MVVYDCILTVTSTAGMGHLEIISAAQAYIHSVYDYYVRLSLTGQDRSRGLQEVEASRILRQSADEGGKTYEPAASTAWGRSLVLISVRGLVDPRA